MIKRLFDIVVSFGGLLVLSPVLLVVMFLVWRQDRHNPFYIAPRVGLNGVLFRMVKMRSMVVNADKTTLASTAASDRRITPIGRSEDSRRSQPAASPGDQRGTGTRSRISERIHRVSSVLCRVPLRRSAVIRCGRTSSDSSRTSSGMQ